MCAVPVATPNDNLKRSDGAKCASISKILRAKQPFEQETTAVLISNGVLHHNNEINLTTSTQSIIAERTATLASM